METWHKASYAILIVLNAVLTEFAIQLGAGNVPIPVAWTWLVPILVAGLTALTLLLPRISDSPPPPVLPPRG